MKPGNKSIWFWLLVLVYIPLAPFCFAGHAVLIWIERRHPNDYRAKMIGYGGGMLMCAALIAAILFFLWRH